MIEMLWDKVAAGIECWGWLAATALISNQVARIWWDKVKNKNRRRAR